MTLSITGRCARTGHLGAAISSFDFGWTFLPSYDDSLDFAHLSLVAAGIGAVTVQANTPPGFAGEVMGLLRKGMEAGEALEQALAGEKGVRDAFQVAVVDAAGRTAAFTGERPQEWRGHEVGNGWVAAGNVLAGGQVVQALGQAFERNEHLPFDERLLVALEAGVAAGGDRRGQRSALLRVGTGDYVTGLEIRVHEHAEPLAELRRLLDACHEERDFLTVALKALAAVRLSVDRTELEQLADMSTYEATRELRDLVAQRGAAAETLQAADRLLAMFSQRMDVAEMRFGDALRLIGGTT